LAKPKPGFEKKIFLAMAGGGWSSLPADLLREVSDRLTAEDDYLHARQVCGHWRASTSPLSAYRPGVLAGRRGADIGDPISEYSLHLLRGAGWVDMAVKPPAGLPYCRGAGHGWLVLSDDLGRLVLWEPLSGAEIPLPCLCPVAQVFLSGDPLAPSHWIAVATKRRVSGLCGIFFWRRGDTAWTELLPREKLSYAIHNVEFHAGIMYFISHFSCIFIFDLKLGTTSAPSIRHCDNVAVSQATNGKLFHSVRVVACGGQMMIVFLFGSRRPSHIEVHKLFRTPPNPKCYDPSLFGGRVTDLAGYSIFLGRDDFFALPAKGFPAIEGNRVYYMAPCLEDTVLGLVFDLKTDAVEEIPYPPPREEDDTIFWRPYSWFCPRRPFLEDSARLPPRL
jgi:hypothetical protein